MYRQLTLLPLCPIKNVTVKKKKNMTKLIGNFVNEINTSYPKAEMTTRVRISTPAKTALAILQP